MKTPIEEKWSRIFASKRYHTKDGVIKFKPLEQQELIDDLRKTAAKEKEQREELIKNAFNAGIDEAYSRVNAGMNMSSWKKKEAEQYYNEVIKPKLNK